jgi:serine protease Do
MMKSLGTSSVKVLLIAMAGGLGALALNGMGERFYAADARQPITIEAPRGAPLSFADLIERVSPAVVSVNVTTETTVGVVNPLEDFLDRFRNGPQVDPEGEGEGESEGEEEGDERRRRGGGVGSGFFISADGHIVTNNHVVEDAVDIEVVLSDGRELKATLVGTDPETDLAVLKVLTPGLFPFVEFSTAQDIRVGDWVVAVGNPFGLGGTATAGIVSAKNRREQSSVSSAYFDYLQVDAAINRGNSGGPTFDLSGRVVGVNTAILSPTGGSVGIGFAIPADVASTITKKLIQDGTVERGWLGVTIQNFSEEMAAAIDLGDQTGAIVSELVDGGPAEKSGLKSGDIILKVGETRVTDSTELTRAVGSLLAGTAHDFRIVRKGKEMTVRVTLDARPRDLGQTLATLRPPGVRAVENADEIKKAALGVSLRPLAKSDRDALKLDADAKGLIIAAVERGGLAEEIGLEPGIAILEVNTQAVADTAAYDAAVKAAEGRGKSHVLLTLRIQDRTQFLPMPLKRDDSVR